MSFPTGNFLYGNFICMSGNFSNWIQKELQDRNWSQADLADKAGITDATVSRLVNDVRGPGPKLCNKLAKALNYPPEFVFKMAGLLPPEKEASPALEEANQLLSELPEEYQKQALQLLRFLHDTHVPYKPKKASKSI